MSCCRCAGLQHAIVGDEKGAASPKMEGKMMFTLIRGREMHDH